LSIGTGLVVIVSTQAHLTRVSPLSRPGTRPGIRPVIREPLVEGTSDAALGFLSPFGHRRSLLGSSCSRRGIGPSSWSAYHPPAEGGPRRGFHVPHSRDSTGVGALSTPGTAVLILDRMPCPASACRFTAACPCTPLPLPTTEPLFTRHQRRFTRFTRPVCPSPVTPRMGREILRLSPRASHPAVTSNARQGRGQASSTRPELRCRHHVGPPNCEFTRKVRPRVATAVE
jgi:hypothetical protein